MTSQNIRFFLLAALIFVGMLLYNAWQQEHPAAVAKSKTENTQATFGVDHESQSKNQDIPKTETSGPLVEEVAKVIPKDRLISVNTDVLELKIDKEGGDIVELQLPAYADDRTPPRLDFVLFDSSPKRYYVAQSGLAGDKGPDISGVGRATYETKEVKYDLAKDQNALTVDLQTRTKEGVLITKRFGFQKGSYVIGVSYLIQNNSTSDYKGVFYTRLKRKPDAESGGGFLGVQTFTGGAIYTPETPYKKITFKDMADKPLDVPVQGGFAAMVEHYFVSAWIPKTEVTSTYQTSVLNNGAYSIGFNEPAVTVPAGQSKEITAALYAGPQITEDLEKLAPGLDLVVDYGILWPIAKPIFWLLKKIYSVVGNWGWAIVIITIIIKLLFYKLSASSYRSMGNMRKLQPKMEALKERYGEDKQKYSQAVMELYRKEKINPLGGCLPILIQIPVFISLYYVLLGSVELRLAPFVLWITDLSAKDPYYVLPVLMGLSMFVQQKLNPAPPDPVQAKVMMFMPVVFTVLFLNFPSGLVLYWLVNNILSIAQQWVITQRIDGAFSHHGAK